MKNKTTGQSVTVLPYTIGYPRVGDGTHISGLEAVRSCPTPTHSAAESFEEKLETKRGGNVCDLLSLCVIYRLAKYMFPDGMSYGQVRFRS